MKVLALASYPINSAATRFRVAQYVEPLSRLGIEMTLEPFLESGEYDRQYRSGGLASKAFRFIPPLARRIRLAARIRRFDLIFVQREAMFFGPALFERLYCFAGRLPMVLDLDDATYVPYVSPTYGRLGSALKFFGKTDSLIRRSSLVVCGNRYIAEHVHALGRPSRVIPTIVDTDIYSPAETDNAVPVLGWIGTHSTFPFLQNLFPVLERLARDHSFKLKVVGAGIDRINIPGVDAESRDWRLESELEDLRSFDIGLYPIFPSSSANEEWIRGKSGFKAIEYMAVGIPVVMSPVGVCAEIGLPGETHFNAASDEDWYNSLSKMISDAELRRRMGRCGRRHAVEFYALPDHAAALAAALRDAVVGSRK
jgi:glycosyltransferase involved in cell wall biosynthesis